MVMSLVHVVKADQPAPSFSFTAAGDYGGIYTSGGQDSTGKTVANAIAGKNPDFHIALGDLGYDSQNPTDWCNSFKAIYPGSGGTGSLVLITGNHDTQNGGTSTFNNPVSGTSTANPIDALTAEDGPGFLDPANTGGNGYVNACGAPSSPSISWVGSGVSNGGSACQVSLTLSAPSCYGREYYFDYPASNPIMRFIMISANIGGSWVGSTGYAAHTCPDSPLSHYCWLSARIQDAKSAGLWVAVAGHKECIMDDSNGCESTLDPFNLALYQGVDLWLDGHDHSYQRSVQLRASCSVSGATFTCGTANTGDGADPTNPYLKGGTTPATVATVVNTIGTGGKPHSDICSTSCPNQNYFIKLCGLNSVIANVPQTTNCNSDYGFSYFRVNTTWLNASFVSTSGTFTDNYYIKVANPPGDFSVFASMASLRVHRGLSFGGPGSSTVIALDSFGGFTNNVVLTASVSGGPTVPTGTCPPPPPGTNCPLVAFSSANVQLSGGNVTYSTLSVSAQSDSTPCGSLTSPMNYTITVTATSGSLSHHFVLLASVYLRGDVTLDARDNIYDLTSVGGAFGSTPTSGTWNPDADLKNDGIINIFDLSLVGNNFGGAC